MANEQGGPPRFPPVDEPAPGDPRDPWRDFPPDRPPFSQPPARPPDAPGTPPWSPPSGGDWSPRSGGDWPPPPGYVPGGPAGYGAPRGHWLHPLDVGRAFGAAFRLYRLRWQAMLGAYAALLLPLTALIVIVDVAIVQPALAGWTAAYSDALLSGSLERIPLPPAEMLLSFGLTLVYGAVGMVASGAVVHVVDANYRGGGAGAGEALRAALARAGSLVGLYLALLAVLIVVGIVGGVSVVALSIVAVAVAGDVGLAIFLSLIGVVGLFAAVIFIVLRWSLAVQAVMVEARGALAALGRSWRLVSGSTWRLLGYSLLFMVIVIIALIVVGIVGAVISPPRFDFDNPSAVIPPSPLGVLVQTVLTSLVSLVVTPWWLGVLTLLYYDLRWGRGELSRDAAGGAPAPPAPAR